MPHLLAIDPGTTQSGWVILDDDNQIVTFGLTENNELLTYWVSEHSGDVAIEMIASYGATVGREIFESCVWIGRFLQASRCPANVELIFRREVKAHLCGGNIAKVKDPQVRQAIIDMYPRTGGGKVPQIGLKDSPGPLYGITKDTWAALGVALTARNVNPHRGTK